MSEKIIAVLDSFGAIPEDNDYAKGWNDCRKSFGRQVREAIKASKSKQVNAIKIFIKDGIVDAVDWSELELKDSNPVNIIAMLNVAIHQVQLNKETKPKIKYRDRAEELAGEIMRKFSGDRIALFIAITQALRTQIHYHEEMIGYYGKVLLDNGINDSKVFLDAHNDCKPTDEREHE